MINTTQFDGQLTNFTASLFSNFDVKYEPNKTGRLFAAGIVVKDPDCVPDINALFDKIYTLFKTNAKEQIVLRDLPRLQFDGNRIKLIIKMNKVKAID